MCKPRRGMTLDEMKAKWPDVWEKVIDQVRKQGREEEKKVSDWGKSLVRRALPLVIEVKDKGIPEEQAHFELWVKEARELLGLSQQKGKK